MPAMLAQALKHVDATHCRAIVPGQPSLSGTFERVVVTRCRAAHFCWCSAKVVRTEGRRNDRCTRHES